MLLFDEVLLHRFDSNGWLKLFEVVVVEVLKLDLVEYAIHFVEHLSHVEGLQLRYYSIFLNYEKTSRN